jgi:hypothetical protein
MDLTGLTFGPFYVVEKSKTIDYLGGKYWECRCNLCGSLKDYRSDILRKRCPKSCGCLGHLINIGDKIGHLTIIEKIKERTRNPKWKCKCECGNDVIRTSASFKGNWQPSCGCLRKQNLGNTHPSYKGYKDLPRSVYNSIKNGAEIRKIKFDITIEYMWNLYIKQNKKCALSGLNIYFGNQSRNPEKKIEKTASLDRIDSSKGYIEGNMQWINKKINIMKNKTNQKDFINMCKKIVEYYNINNTVLL